MVVELELELDGKEQLVGSFWAGEKKKKKKKKKVNR